MFQLALIACHGGQADKTSTAFVPIHLDELYFRTGNDQDWGIAIAHGELRGLRGAYANLQLVNQSDEMVLDIDNPRCISYSESKPLHISQNKAFASPITRLVWKPDIRSLNNGQCQNLFPPPQENVSRVAFFDSIHSIAHLIVLDIYERFVKSGDGPKPSGDLSHFLSWIRRQVEGEKTQSFTKAKQFTSHGRLDVLK